MSIARTSKPPRRRCLEPACISHNRAKLAKKTLQKIKRHMSSQTTDRALKDTLCARTYGVCLEEAAPKPGVISRSILDNHNKSAIENSSDSKHTDQLHDRISYPLSFCASLFDGLTMLPNEKEFLVRKVLPAYGNFEHDGHNTSGSSSSCIQSLGHQVWNVGRPLLQHYEEEEASLEYFYCETRTRV